MPQPPDIHNFVCDFCLGLLICSRAYPSHLEPATSYTLGAFMKGHDLAYREVLHVNATGGGTPTPAGEDVPSVHPE
jgi:hypothetical protein